MEIKTWLVRRGLRQADLATALGISQPSVSQRLLGKISFSLDELLMAANLLEITLGELMGSELLNARGPHPDVQDEGLSELPRLDSNQQPFD